MTHELVIRGGTVVDGTGLAAYRADVGVDGGLITEIGRIHDSGERQIDAEGHVVTPGFIDVHTHMDAQVFWDPLGTPVCWHGVTTAVMGHCGFTLAPSAESDKAFVIRNLERAEDISGEAMAAGIAWSWTTFAEYLDTVDRLPKGINYAANIGHSPLRTYVMGERAFTEAANDDDLAGMCAQLGDALRAGAIGFTTSRSKNHQTSDDRPVASRLAEWSEVDALIRHMGDSGGGIFQMVADWPPTAEARAAYEAGLVQLAAESGVPFALPAVGGNNDSIMALLDRMAAAGGRAFGITHCRGIGSMSSFAARLPFDELAEWQPIRALPREEQTRALRDPDVRARLIHAAHHGPYKDAVGAEARRPEFELMRVMDRPVPPNPTVAEVAAAHGVDPVEAMIDLALENFETFFLQRFGRWDVENILKTMRHPRTVLGFSDAGAHVSQMCDASLPSHLLAHWVRDRQDFTLEEGIRMLTLDQARWWGFHDRGVVRVGAKADLNVLDPATVTPDMPTVVNDLPANQRRIKQTATGYLATIVNGRVTLEGGEPSGALPGQLLRGPLAVNR